MSELMSRKTLRLNVLCDSRSKKFLVLGEKESTVLELLASIKKMFLQLYPEESTLEISGVKNQDGFDIFLSYKLGDLFEDNASLKITEDPVSGGQESKKNTDSITSSVYHDNRLAGQNDEDTKVPDEDNEDNEEEEESSVKKTTEKQSTENLTSFKRPKNEDSETTSTKKSKTEEVISKKNGEDDDVPAAKETKRSHSESADEQDKKKKRKRKKSGK